VVFKSASRKECILIRGRKNSIYCVDDIFAADMKRKGKDRTRMRNGEGLAFGMYLLPWE
jgi:hypothetical protein